MLTRGPMALAMEDMTTCRPEAETFVFEARKHLIEIIH